MKSMKILSHENFPLYGTLSGDSVTLWPNVTDKYLEACGLP